MAMTMAWSPFLRDFDAELELEASQLNREDHGPSEEEIAARIQAAADEAREAGFREGRAEALAEAEATLAAARVSALETLKPKLVELAEGLGAHRRAVEADLHSFLIALCEKAIPHLVKLHGPVVIESELRKVARRAQGSRWLEVRVSPANHQGVKQALKDLIPADAQNELRVIPDERLGDSEIRAGWQGGSSSMSYERLCKAIIEKLKSTNSRTADQEENSL